MARLTPPEPRAKPGGSKRQTRRPSRRVNISSFKVRGRNDRDAVRKRRVFQLIAATRWQITVAPPLRKSPQCSHVSHMQDKERGTVPSHDFTLVCFCGPLSSGPVSQSWQIQVKSCIYSNKPGHTSNYRTALFPRKLSPGCLLRLAIREILNKRNLFLMNPPAAV